MKTNYVLCLLAVFQLGCDAQSPPQAPTSGAPAAPSSTEAALSDSTGESSSADAEAVTVQIKDYEGLQELIAGKRGKVVVMDCWSTFCDPCVKEFPGLVKLHENYGPDRVACVSLNFNYEGGKNDTPQEHQESVLDFLRSQHATFDNVLASVPAEELYGLLGFETASIPAIFVYDREGKIARRFEGPAAQYSEVEKLVAQLAEKP